MSSFKEEEKGVSTGKVIIAIIIVLAVGYGGYQVYTEREAMKNTEVIITDSDIPDVGLTEISVPIYMEFQNNSDYGSTPLNADYQILVNDEEIDNGKVNVPKIPAGESKTVETTVTINGEDVSDTFWSTLETGSFEIKVEGEITAKLLFGIVPVSQPFQTTYKIGE